MPAASRRTIRFSKPVNRLWQSDAYKISRDRPIVASHQGLPIGTGRMGAMVWTLEDRVCLCVNHVNLYAMDGTSQSFFQRNTDYCGGCGLVDIVLSSENGVPFPAAPFYRELDLDTGRVRIKGAGVTVEAVACPDRDIFALRVRCERGRDEPVSVRLRMLRPPDACREQHTARSRFREDGGDVSLAQHFVEKEYESRSVLTVRMPGREARFRPVDEQTVALEAPGDAECVILLATAATRGSASQLADRVRGQLDAAGPLGFDLLADQAAEWWHRFWQCNGLSLHSADGTADRLQSMSEFYLYCMACSGRGEFPPKFNGMLWVSHGDVRPWGAQHWWHNLACLARPLHGMADDNLGAPVYEMYWNMRNAARLAARQQWGSRGLFFGEIAPFNGPDPLPDDIAAEMRDLYLCRTPWSPSQRFLDYAYRRNPRESRWNWKYGGQWVEGKWTYRQSETAPFGPTVHLLSSGARIAWQFWMRYEHSMDRTFLRKRAYPILKGVLEFFRHFPNLRLGGDGRYHIHHVNLWEYRIDATDPIDCVAALHALTGAAIRAAEILDIDSELCAEWQAFRTKLPRFPTQTDADGHDHWVHAANNDTLGHNTLFPVSYWPDVVNPESEDEELFAVAQHTLDLASPPHWPPPDSRVDALDGRTVATAVLGRTERLRQVLPALVRPGFLHGNGFSPRESAKLAPGTTVQCHGVLTQCLQIALCASLAPRPGGDPVLRPFHAWPADWDAEFAFRVRGAFTVRGCWRDGKARWLEVESRAGGPLRIRCLHDPHLVRCTRNAAVHPLPEAQPWVIPTAQGDCLRFEWQHAGTTDG